MIVFTHADGAHPAWSVHLKCRRKSPTPCTLSIRWSTIPCLVCHTNYHNNYSVQAGIRTYYPGVPPFIQVGEHQFVQRELVMQWIDLMQVAYVFTTGNVFLFFADY